MDILQKFFERNDLRFGELCDRCYRLWYKHKRTKPSPNGGNKEGGKSSTSTANSPSKMQQQHESFHGKQSDSAQTSEEEDDTPVDDSSADEDNMQVADDEQQQRTSPVKKQQIQQQHTPQLVKIFQQQNALQQQKYLTRPSKIEKYVVADFSNCMRALAALAKPARKSRRKNTPVRSAPRVDSMHELVYGYGATSSTLARIVLLREEQQEFLLSLCGKSVEPALAQQQSKNKLVEQENALPVHEETRHEDITMATGNSAAEREGNFFAQMIQAASTKIAVQSS